MYLLTYLLFEPVAAILKRVNWRASDWQDADGRTDTVATGTMTETRAADNAARCVHIRAPRSRQVSLSVCGDVRPIDRTRQWDRCRVAAIDRCLRRHRHRHRLVVAYS